MGHYGKAPITDSNIISAYNRVFKQMNDHEFEHMIEYFYDPELDQDYFPKPKEMLNAVYKYRSNLFMKRKQVVPDKKDIAPQEEVKEIVKKIAEDLKWKKKDRRNERAC